MQTALELYYNDFGRYPGISHYKSVACAGGSPLGSGQPLWTTAGIFDASFRNNYMPTLPSDPTGNCYTYFQRVGAGATVWRRYTPTATLDPNLYTYLLTFESESGLSNVTFPGWQSSGAARRCILGPLI